MNADAPPSLLRRAAAAVAARLIIVFARLVTGVRALGGTTPAGPTVYFANHTSHGDFVLVWATLPPVWRRRTQPVAGSDYWLTSALRRFIGRDVFHALMIPRDAGSGADSIHRMAQVLAGGDSLILFPEGTRNTTDDALLPLKSGLYHLARECPGAALVPVWIENLRRVLPKGSLLPVPLACSVHYGAPLALADGEDKAAFLARARAAMLALRPEHDREGTAP